MDIERLNCEADRSFTFLPSPLTLVFHFHDPLYALMVWFADTLELSRYVVIIKTSKTEIRLMAAKPSGL
jgi:hypothetical protein